LPPINHKQSTVVLKTVSISGTTDQMVESDEMKL